MEDDIGMAKNDDNYSMTQALPTALTRATHSVPEVVGEHEVPGEGVGEGVVEVQHLQQLLPLDGVQVAVGEGTHVGGALAHRGVLPEGVAEDVTLSEDGHHLVVLDHLQGPRHDEAQCVQGLPRVEQKIPWNIRRPGQ